MYQLVGNNNIFPKKIEKSKKNSLPYDRVHKKIPNFSDFYETVLFQITILHLPLRPFISQGRLNVAQKNTGIPLPASNPVCF